MTKALLAFCTTRLNLVKWFVKTRFPLVRRRQLIRAENRQLTAIKELTWQAPRACEAVMVAVKPVSQQLRGEICLFVTFSNQPVLKNHVKNHIEQLLSAGVQVVLVINTPTPHTPLAIETPLASKLAGLYFRENTGFDFAAWAHLLHLMPDTSNWKRLFLINDSLVGPLDERAFHNLIMRVRRSDSDFLGLTQNLYPQWHLQSFFLVFNASALQHPFFFGYFARIVSLTSKETVINVYETKFTQALVDNGLRFEVLFPLGPGLPHLSNRTIKHWEQLLEAGFPYVKTSVVRELRNDPRLLKLVPERYLDA
jgi:hypothetical protein